MAIIIGLLWRCMLIAAGAGAAWQLATGFGPAAGLAIWAGGMLLGCGVGAGLLRTSPVGSVNWHNHVGGALLPWGYRLSNGKLVPLTIIAWITWVAIGAAAGALRCPTSEQHPLLALLLFATWMLYGGLCLRQLGFVFGHFRNSPRPRQTMIVLTLIMLGLTAASLVFWRMGMVGSAVAVADGPLAVFGAGYGLFFGAMLAVHGKGRWN